MKNTVDTPPTGSGSPPTSVPQGGALAATAPGSSGPSFTSRLHWRSSSIDLFDFWPLAVMLVVIIYTSTQSPYFLTTTNFKNILAINAPLAMMAMGQTFLLISAGLDLSIGYNASFAAIVTGLLMQSGHPMWFCIGAGIFAATAVGFTNGVLCSLNRAHPFIITLGMSIFLFGVSTELTGGAPVNDMKILYSWFGGLLPSGFPFFGLPAVALPLFVIVAFAFCFLRWSPIGRRAFAIGGNEEAAYLSGIPVRTTKIILYTLMGLIVGIAAMCLAGYIDEASFNLAQNYELQTIAACVIGGTALFGGRGGAFRSLQGVALLALVNNSVNFVHNIGPITVDANYQQILLGIIIVIAVMVSRRG